MLSNKDYFPYSEHGGSGGKNLKQQPEFRSSSKQTNPANNYVVLSVMMGNESICRGSSNDVIDFCDDDIIKSRVARGNDSSQTGLSRRTGRTGNKMLEQAGIKVLTVYSQFTHRVLTGYSQGTHSVLTVYSQVLTGTHSLLTGYSQGTRWVLTVYSQCTHRYSQFTQNLLTGYSQGTRWVLTVYSQVLTGTHSVLTGSHRYSQFTHRVLTVYSQGTHRYSQFTHREQFYF
ncbi:hypothetical protein Btru_049548 [Bulinus truncatus]|nr:hypothetical protein Btru_049548 [Bulinus truncatus]